MVSLSNIVSDLEDERCEERFSSYWLALRFLGEMALTSGSFLDCGQGTDVPTTAYFLALGFYMVRASCATDI